MKHILIALLALSAALLLAAPAQAGPAQKEIDSARAECHARKVRVQKLEADRAGDPAVSSARDEWESACAKANALMDARDERSPPAPAEAPAEMDAS